MTTSYSKLAAFDVISYFWEEIKNAGILDPTDYYVDEFEEELRPIIPVQDLAETRNYLGDKPYLVYEVIAMQPRDGNYFIKQEQIVFTVYSPSFGKLVEICAIADDALNRSSVTGADITKFKNSEFTFHCFDTEYEIVGASDSEGGRMDAMIVCWYEYTRDLDGFRRFSL